MESSPKRKKSIVVSGYYGYHNLGDDAILGMICRDLAEDYDLTVLTLRPRETAQLYNVKTVNRYRLLKVLRTLNRADLLLSGGGSLLQDKTSTRSLLYYLSILRMAQRRGVPTMIYACGIGPIRWAGNRRRSARVLRNVDMISLRDQESLDFVQQLCPGRKPDLTADPVFHLKPSPDAVAEAILERNGIRETALFAVSLRKMKRAEKLRMAALLDRIAVLSGCTPVFLNMQDPADVKIARSVQRLMKQSSYLLDGCRDAADTTAVLRRTRGVVSMRLHTLIFGALASVPLAGFDVDPKVGAFLRSVNAQDPLHLEDFDPEETAAQIARILEGQRLPDLAGLPALSEKAPAMVRSFLAQEDRRSVMCLISGGDVGGAKTHVVSLLQGLIRRGCRVVLTCFMDGDFADDARAAGIPVMIPPRCGVPGILRWLETYIRRNGVDVLHCHGSRANMYGSLLLSRVNVPVITTIHSDPDLDYLGRPGAKLVFGTINRHALRKIPWQICVSDALREKMAARGLPWEHLFRINNGIDFENSPALVTRDKWFEARDLRIPESAVLFGTAARLSPVKDLSTLIRAFSLVARQHPDARLLIAGDGPESKKLRAEAEQSCPAGSVYFAGWLEDTASFFNAIDVNVLTSLSEGLPYAIPEGGRMRCATISTRVGSIPAIISDGETGFLIEPGDAATLAERMTRLIEDPALRRELGDALYRKIEREYSLKNMVEKQLEIYDTICGSPSSDRFDP